MRSRFLRDTIEYVLAGKPGAFFVVILAVLFLIFIVAFRKHFSHLFVASDILSDGVKNLSAVLCLGSAFIGAAFLVGHLRQYAEAENIEVAYEYTPVIIGTIVFFILLYLFSVVAEKLLYYSNPGFKDWKDT